MNKEENLQQFRSTTHFQNMHIQRQHQMSEKALLHWEEVWSEIHVQDSNYSHKCWMWEKRVSSPGKRPPPTVRTMSTTRTKMQGLEESLSKDQQMDEEPASSFCGSCDSLIETMGESRPDSYESLKEQLQRTDETSKGKFTKTSHCYLTYLCRASH